VLPVRGLPRGRARVRREAQAPLARALTAPAKVADLPLRSPDPSVRRRELALLALLPGVIFTDAIPTTDWRQTDAREGVSTVELLIPLVAFLVVLAFVAWKTPSASRR
jgi:hypothetical protein